MKEIARNKKAFFDYEILESLEAGVVLAGSEVKAIRAGRVNLKDNFVKIIRGEAFLFGVHVSHLQTASAHYTPDERRVRKLLLHKKQLAKWSAQVGQQRLSIVALKLYFNARNRVKLQVALVRGKKLYDKRESMKQRVLDMEAKSQLKHRG
ncbi:SsrA-binding protein [Helicobacter ailurogastricus]|uniref:SsrA-binding protein n=1 Tax=Helicobacter ailurogastricus TaxID=1578720 RepID=A0A0K2XGZ7_9HELI|nr:SsrA-binding protein [Helicobacter ailurogastricus]CRF40463.1 tmRNA-binding protein SmpB [Helicobacter ailurogastricus]CRF43436.1 tmRNA-binding protein SmpB [Helicobacter ailurogastricus]CRF43989.1 tmRNA-binding protein SmpB [Helicobacter ailurogastricus]GLH58178.1 SsrA-binding protein SmpB [Helicobacter ailurogastricus]GLH59084.1 SsrA-binding protein SmpB [Helicobacter ailurogastricus]